MAASRDFIPKCLMKTLINFSNSAPQTVKYYPEIFRVYGIEPSKAMHIPRLESVRWEHNNQPYNIPLDFEDKNSEN
jgi:hypothetical protein